eukprot:4437733-Prymnesium_polylepis.1
MGHARYADPFGRWRRDIASMLLLGLGLVHADILAAGRAPSAHQSTTLPALAAWRAPSAHQSTTLAA